MGPKFSQTKAILSGFTGAPKAWPTLAQTAERLNLSAGSSCQKLEQRLALPVMTAGKARPDVLPLHANGRAGQSARPDFSKRSEPDPRRLAKHGTIGADLFGDAGTIARQDD